MASGLRIVRGFVMEVAAPHELVIENAYDGAHFRPVHRVVNEPDVRVSYDEDGALVGHATLRVPASPWQRDELGARAFDVPIEARAYSPGLVISEMGGARPYTVVTAATPSAGGCTVRLSFGWPREAAPPPEPLQDYMIALARAVWERVTFAAPERLTPRDAGVVAFRAFCASFADAAVPG
jgi:hypothetical protein